MIRSIVFLLVLLMIAVPAFAHECCYTDMDAAIDEAIKNYERNELDKACTYSQQLGEMRDGVTQGSYQYWRAYQYWTERCEELQEVLIDEAY